MLENKIRYMYVIIQDIFNAKKVKRNVENK